MPLSYGTLLILKQALDRRRHDLMKAAPTPIVRRTLQQAVVLARRLAADLRAFGDTLPAARIESAIASGLIGQINFIIDWAVMSSKLDAELNTSLRTSYLDGARDLDRTLRRTGVNIRFDIMIPRAQEWAARFSGQLITEILEDQRVGVSRLVEAAHREARTPHETATSLRDIMGLHSRQVTALERYRERLIAAEAPPEKVARLTEKYANALLNQRTMVIARTELLRATHEGQLQLAREGILAGQIDKDRTYRRWIVTDDDRLDTELCIHGSSKILTIDGWKRVGAVQVGDLVLTHEDRFRKVTKTFSRHYSGMAVSLNLGGRARIKLTATYGHRVLTERGWVRIESITEQDAIIVSAVPCACGTLIPLGYGKPGQCAECARSAKARYTHSVERKAKISESNNRRWSKPENVEKSRALMMANNPTKIPGVIEKIRRAALRRPPRYKKPKPVVMTAKEWGKHPNHPFRRKDFKAITTAKLVAWTAALSPSEKQKHFANAAHLSLVALGQKNNGGTFLERKMKHFLETQQIQHEAQWPFTYLFEGKKRSGVSDFFIPGARVVIECDGFMHERPDVKLKDEQKNSSLQSQGYTVLRFTDAQIRKQFHEVASAIRAHCCLIALKPNKIEHKHIAHQAVFDLTVEDDHSFIAGGVVVHNCLPMSEPDLGEVKIDEPWILPNGEAAWVPQDSHPNCFIGSTRVAGLAEAGLRIWYEGPIYELQTARGHRLSVTPNHPIATRDGLLPASTLRQGDYVLSDTRPVWFAEFLRCIHNEHAPSTIQEVVETLRLGGFTAAQIGALDLHGDARWTDRQVEIVGTDRPDIFDHNPASLQDATKRIFHGRAMQQPLVASLRAQQLRGQRVCAASSHSPGASHLAFDESSVLLDELPLQQFRIGPSTDWNVALTEAAKEHLPTYRQFARQLLERSAGLIALDKIVDLRLREFVGHVYDLQMKNGFILAEGIVTSNCRCSWSLVTKNATDEPGN